MPRDWRPLELAAMTEEVVVRLPDLELADLRFALAHPSAEPSSTQRLLLAAITTSSTFCLLLRYSSDIVVLFLILRTLAQT